MILEKGFTDTNYERSNKGMSYLENNLIDSDRNMYLTVDSLIEINNIINVSNNFTWRNVNVNPYGFDQMYVDKNLI